MTSTSNTNIQWRNMSALLVSLLSFQGVIALRGRLVGIFKPGLFTWVRAQAVLTDAAVKCAWIDSCVFVRSCSALHGWSPLSFWSSCSQWSLGHQMMWVKREQCCEHQLALFRGPLNTLQGFWHFNFGLNYRPTSAVWSNPSSQATKTLTQWCTRVLLSLTSSKQRWVMWSISLQSVISFPLKLFFLLDLMCLQTLIRYIKTMLLPINMLIVGFIAGRVSCFHLDNGWFTPLMFWYVCPAFICLHQYSRFTNFCQFGVYQFIRV